MLVKKNFGKQKNIRQKDHWNQKKSKYLPKSKNIGTKYFGAKEVWYQKNYTKNLRNK